MLWLHAGGRLLAMRDARHDAAARTLRLERREGRVVAAFAGSPGVEAGAPEPRSGWLGCEVRGPLLVRRARIEGRPAEPAGP